MLQNHGPRVMTEGHKPVAARLCRAGELSAMQAAREVFQLHHGCVRIA